MISCGDKKTYNNYRSSLQFISKNKYFINTNNTDYIKQGSKTKKRLMSRRATKKKFIRQSLAIYYLNKHTIEAVQILGFLDKGQWAHQKK